MTTTKSLCQDICCPVRDWDQKSFEYESNLLSGGDHLTSKKQARLCIQKLYCHSRNILGLLEFF
jgi:hypothetical protein